MSSPVRNLKELCSLITKGTTPTSIGLAFADSGVPFLRVQNVSGGRVNIQRDTLFINEAVHRELRRSQIYPGDILLSIAGTIGRTGVVPANAPQLNCNQALAIIRTGEDVFRPYLHHWLESAAAQSQMRGATVTGTIQNLSLTQVGALLVPLPAMQEQRRIATILDQADAIRDKRREALAQLNCLTQSIFIEMFGDPVTNPMNWQVGSLTDVCHCYSGGTPSKACTQYWQGTLPWFSAKDLKADDLSDAQDHIADSVPQTTNLKLLPPNTIVICVRGMILAHTFQVSVLRVPGTINQDLKALIPREPMDTEFLAACIRAQSNFVLKQVSEAGHGTKRLDSSALTQIKILRPPEKLQLAFALRANAIRDLKNQHRTALVELNKLFSSLQHRAFQGEL